MMRETLSPPSSPAPPLIMMTTKILVCPPHGKCPPMAQDAAQDTLRVSRLTAGLLRHKRPLASSAMKILLLFMSLSYLLYLANLYQWQGPCLLGCLPNNADGYQQDVIIVSGSNEGKSTSLPEGREHIAQPLIESEGVRHHDENFAAEEKKNDSDVTSLLQIHMGKNERLRDQSSDQLHGDGSRHSDSHHDVTEPSGVTGSSLRGGSSSKQEDDEATPPPRRAEEKPAPPAKRWKTAKELPECSWVSKADRRVYERDNSTTLSLIYESQIGLLEEAMAATDHSYVMLFGAAMGVYRHGGAIPWDLDMDVLVLEEDDGADEMQLAKKVFKDLEVWLELNKMAGRTTCRTLTTQGNSYREKSHQIVDWYDPYYGEELDSAALVKRDIPFLRLHLFNEKTKQMDFAYQVDMFINNKLSRKALALPSHLTQSLCRCYFNGIPVRCSENTLPMLEEEYGPSVTTPKINFDVADRETLSIRRDGIGWYGEQLRGEGESLCHDEQTEGETWIKQRNGDIPMGGESLFSLTSPEWRELVAEVQK